MFTHCLRRLLLFNVIPYFYCPYSFVTNLNLHRRINILRFPKNSDGTKFWFFQRFKFPEYLKRVYIMRGRNITSEPSLLFNNGIFQRFYALWNTWSFYMNISHTIAVFVLPQENKCVRLLFSIAIYFNWQL